MMFQDPGRGDEDRGRLCGDRRKKNKEKEKKEEERLPRSPSPFQVQFPCPEGAKACSLGLALFASPR